MNAVGLLTERQPAGPDDATDAIYTYNANGSTQTVTDAAGVTGTHRYDLYNRLVGADTDGDVLKM